MFQKFISIEGLGLFNGKESFNSAPDFNEFNIVYGPNGTGKTSLSRAFQILATGNLPDSLSKDHGSVRVSCKVSGKSINFDSTKPTAFLGQIEVFNVDYIWENISWGENDLSGIITFEKNKKKAAGELKAAEILKEKILIQINGDTSDPNNVVIGAKSKLSVAKNELDEWLKNKARTLYLDYLPQEETFNARHLKKEINLVKKKKNTSF